MGDSEDHREKNILLAKNLNEVKMDLRCKKRNIVTLQTQLRHEQQRNSKLELDQVSIVNRIDTLKKQLDDTFIKNTFGYIHLSKQLDAMHQDSIQSIGDSSMLSPPTTANTTESLFLEKIKIFSESLILNGENHDVSNNRSMNNSKLTNSQHSLSFNSFEIGLNSTFVKDTDAEADADTNAEDSELNTTFSTNQLENTSHDETIPLQEIQPQTLMCAETRNVNITMRRAKAMAQTETPKVKSKTRKYRSNGHKENRSPYAKMMILRRAKKIDYNEASFWRNKSINF